MNYTLRMCAGACAVVMLGAQALAGESVTLEPRWANGATAGYTFVIENTQATTTVGSGEGALAKTSTMTTTQKIDLTRKVLQESKGPSGGMVLAITYTRVQVRLAMGEESIDVDTSLPPEKDGDVELGESCRQTVGRTYQLWFDESGKLVKIDGNNLTQGNAPTSQSLIGDEVFRSQLAPLYGLPGAPKKASVGDKWGGTTRQAAGHLGTIVTEMSSTLASAAGGVGKVSISGTPSITPAVGPMALKTQVAKGSLDASAEWDSSAGGLKSWDSTRAMTYSVEGPGGKTSIDGTLKIKIQRQDAGGEAGKTSDTPSTPPGQNPNK